MKIWTLTVSLILACISDYGQNKIPQPRELEGTTWKDYMCTANKENYKYKTTDIITFYSFKKDSAITTWTINKTHKDYIAHGKWRIENGVLIIYNMKYENASYGDWVEKWTMKIESVDPNTLRLWTPCRSELPAWLYVKKIH